MEDVQIPGTTIQNVLTTATWCPCICALLL